MGKCVGSLLPSSTQASSLPFTPPAYLSIHLFASLRWLSSLTPNLNPRPASPLSTYGTDLDLTYWGLGPPHMHNGFHIYLPDTAPEGRAEAEQNALPCTTRLVHHACTIRTVFHSSGTWIWARAQLPGWVIGIRASLDQLKAQIATPVSVSKVCGHLSALPEIRALRAGPIESPWPTA